MRLGLPSGTELGGFRIETEVGRGGMGFVYLATDLALGRRVALKVLAPELAEDEEFRERFHRESRLAAAFEHPNVVPIFQAGEAEGLLFIAMRYVDGTDLRAVLRKEQQLEAERTIAILSQVASALDAAHAHGLVHRDVKPANVLLAEGARPRIEHAYLADFGVAKPMVASTVRSEAGAIYGTLDYMAPEQIEGRPVDARTDVYALGCVLFECLVGTPPFRRETAVATASAHLHEPAPLPSASGPRLPQALDTVIGRALSKVKFQRYAGCGELVNAAGEALGDVGAAATAHEATHQRAHALTERREERKIVSVLRCDLMSSLSRGGGDPEDVRALERSFLTLVRTQVQRFGGTVPGSSGVGATAIFGVPASHEDDPERAVRAALRIQDAVRDMNSSVRGDLQFRAGIATGESIVAFEPGSEDEAEVSGEVVGIAGRVHARSPGNAIAVDERTYKATKDSFEYTELAVGAPEQEGRALKVWRAIGPVSRFGAELSTPRASPLIGRDLELSMLTGLFVRAAKDRLVHLVTVVGEPGVGKSRLVNELSGFVDDYPDLVMWRQGRCLPYGEGITFWALGEIVKAQSGILDSDAPETAAQKIDRTVPDDHPDGAWLRQRLRPLVGLEAPQAAREENFTAWRRFLESMAEKNPCVFVIEDLHWADETMLEFIEHVVEYTHELPILLVSTTRPELFESASGFAQSARNSSRVNLGPLSDSETTLLVSELLERAPVPAAVSSVIVERSEGNPLFAEEYIRLLKDIGTLTRDRDAWVLGRDAEIPVPTGLQGLIAARLDTLPPEQKSMLADASVIGKVFWVGAVAAMGGRARTAVSDALHALSRRDLVRPHRTSSMEGEAEYGFWHGLVRDVCYQEIPRARRAEKHRAAAAWIEQMAGQRAEDLAEILASHYVTALDLMNASGEREGLEELSGSARRFLMLAGDRALGLDAERSEHSYRRSLELTSSEDPAWPRIMARLAEALMQRAHFAEADSAFGKASEAFRTRGDARSLAVTAERHAMTLWRLGDVRHRELQAESLAVLEALPASPELVDVLAGKAGSDLVSGDSRAAAAAAERAIATARQLGLPDPPRALGFRGAALCSLGKTAGLDDLRQGAQLASELGLGRDAALMRSNLAVARWPIEGPRSSLEALDETVDFAARRGIEDVRLGTLAVTLNRLADLGSLDQVLSRGADLVDRAEVAGDIYALLLARPALMRVAVVRGDQPEGRTMVEASIREARGIADTQILALVFPPAAALALVRGEEDDAFELLSELEQAANSRDDYDYVSNLPSSVRSAIATGDEDLARRLVSGVRPVFPLHEHSLASAKALLAESNGHHDEAARLFDAAASRWERFEVPYERAQALLRQGRCLLALSRPTEATSPLRLARDILSDLRAGPPLAESTALLNQAEIKA